MLRKCHHKALTEAPLASGVVVLLVVGAALLVLIVGQNLIDIIQRVHQDKQAASVGHILPAMFIS
jgi:hypothetical protein